MISFTYVFALILMLEKLNITAYIIALHI